MQELQTTRTDIEMIPLAEVRRITGMGTTFIYTRAAEGKFPRQRKIGRSARWVKSEVMEWVKDAISQ